MQVRESPGEYRDVTLPFIKAIPPARLQWVHNILQKQAGLLMPHATALPCMLHAMPHVWLLHQAEADRLIFEDAAPDVGFVLHPDMHWVSDPVTAKQLRHQQTSHSFEFSCHLWTGPGPDPGAALHCHCAQVCRLLCDYASPTGPGTS